MNDAQPVSNRRARTIAASFAAGVAAMTVAGAMSAFVAYGGLDAPAANASETPFGETPEVRPLDVRAVGAELDAAEARLRETVAATDGAVARLARLD